MAEQAHVAEYKKKLVKRFEDLIKEYPIVGALNLQDMPAPQLQQMRGKLRGQVVILMTKRRILKIAIENSKDVKKGIEELKEHLKGMPALLFTKENPFSLFKTIKKNKTKAPAKPGQTAPMDIVVKAGPTPFAPGPIISELAQFGLKAGVEGAKVAIKEDAVVVKEGEEISAELAGLLIKLGIEPMEIGLDIVAVYEDGVIYGKDVLDIDEDQFMANLNNAARWGINLAVEAGYFTKEIINLMIPKAHNDALALAREQDIMTSATVGEVLAKAEGQMNSLKDTANISVEAKPKEAPKEEVKEEKKEEAKVEEKPKEEPKEEAKPEEKKEEAPKEEPKKEEKKPKVEEKKEEKVEEKPKEEPKEEKKEEPKVEEALKEEMKEEMTKEVPKEPEEPKEEKKEEVPKEEPKPEPVKEEPKVEEKKEEVKDIPKEEMKEEMTKEVPKEPEEPKVEEKPKEEPKPEPVKEGPKKEEIKEEPKKEKEKKEEEKPSPSPDVQAEQQKAEKLFEELKKKGTLRGVDQKQEIKVPEEKTPQDIIAEGVKKQKEKDNTN